MNNQIKRPDPPPCRINVEGIGWCYENETEKLAKMKRQQKIEMYGFMILAAATGIGLMIFAYIKATSC
jgi:hypothetical protein